SGRSGAVVAGRWCARVRPPAAAGRLVRRRALSRTRARRSLRIPGGGTPSSGGAGGALRRLAGAGLSGVGAVEQPAQLARLRLALERVLGAQRAAAIRVGAAAKHALRRMRARVLRALAGRVLAEAAFN